MIKLLNIYHTNNSLIILVNLLNLLFNIFLFKLFKLFIHNNILLY